MAKKLFKLLVLLLLSQLNLHCQMQQKTPEFVTEICHPDNKYLIVPVYDYIKTLENTPAGLPYGHSSDSWGSSGKMWTAQKGTPIGFEITYYSRYEDKYYHIDENFDVTYIKEMVSRCYPSSDEDSDTPVKEFVYENEWEKIKRNNNVDTSYSRFDGLVFGFAPQGMIVVWLGYSPIRKELGRYQATVITDEKKIAECKKKYLATYRLSENRYEEAKKELAQPNSSPVLWDNYRLRYNWNYKVTSDNKGFKLLGVSYGFFNGETDRNFSPYLLNPEMKKRAIPEVLTLFWETSVKERYQSKLFFDWEKTNALLKLNPNNTFIIHIDKNNSKVEITLNNEIVPVDSIRIYPNSVMRFRESYRD